MHRSAVAAKALAALPGQGGPGIVLQDRWSRIWYAHGSAGCALREPRGLSGQARAYADLSRIPPRQPSRTAAGDGPAVNGPREDPIHQASVAEFRRREAALGNPAAEELSDARIKYRGLASSCPARTKVDRVVDLTPAGLRDGFPTAYGAMTVMRVEPGERTWDGIRVREELTTVSNTCPATFAPTPECSGRDSFPVGGPANSDRIGNQPGLVNRFYDFHVTKSRALSRLHDPSRNPGGLDACRTVCEQKYFCEDREIGRHTVTRDFRKGVFDGQQVTLVTVGKT